MSQREDELQRKVDELNNEILRLRLNEQGLIRNWWKDMAQMLLQAITPLIVGYATWLGYQANSKLDTADANRTRIEEKIDEAKETTKSVAVTAEKAAERAQSTVEHVKLGTQEIKTAVAELKGKMGDAAPPDDK
jgi:hypothetical protein